MSDSSAANPTRCLRLERLENRSLLAGSLMAIDLLEFAHVDGGFDSLNRSVPNLEAAVLNNAVINNAARRAALNNTPQKIAPQNIAVQYIAALNTTALNNAIQAAVGDILDGVRQQSLPDSTVGSPQLQRADSTRSETASAAAVSAETAGNAANVTDSFDASHDIANPRSPTVDAVLVSIANEWSASGDVIDEFATGGTVGDVSTINTADASARESIGQIANRSRSWALGTIELDSIEPGGTVDLTPLLPRSFRPADDSSEAAWELDRDILPRLSQTIEVTPNEFAPLADKVVTQWFGESGGMVAVDHVQLPSVQFTLDNAIVDIHLESTVMLYRSLNIFTASSESPVPIPISGEVMDAIMTTLGKLAKSEIQPVGSVAAMNVSSIAYSAIAIAGAAISARQRPKKPDSATRSTIR